tara:strand:- start:120 stop:674 length:555 start_codon:yes stop_codon:yes gene_type:complete
MSGSEVSKGLERLAGIWDDRYMPVIGVFCLLIVFDIVDRLAPQNVTVSRPSVSVDALLIGMPRLNDQTYQAYLDKLASHVAPVTADTLEPEDSIGAGAQNDVWQVGAFSYRLLAVFQSVDQFAVLHRTNVVSGEREVIEARLGDVIGQHTVSEIASHKILVTSGKGERVELVLFEPVIRDKSNS